MGDQEESLQIRRLTGMTQECTIDILSKPKGWTEIMGSNEMCDWVEQQPTRMWIQAWPRIYWLSPQLYIWWKLKYGY